MYVNNIMYVYVGEPSFGVQKLTLAAAAPAFEHIVSCWITTGSG